MAIVLVVFGHAVDKVVVEYGAELAVVSASAAFFAPFRMPLLVFLSGMLLPHSMLKSRSEYLMGKVSGVLWPYLLWSAAFISVSLIGSSDSAAAEPGFIAKVFYAPPTYLWYLAFLFCYYLMALLIPQRLFVPLGALLLLVSAFVPQADLEKFLYLFFFFVLGDLAGRNAERFSELYRTRWLAVSCAALAILGAALNLAAVELRYQAIGTPFVAAAILAWLARRLKIVALLFTLQPSKMVRRPRPGRAAAQM